MRPGGTSPPPVPRLGVTSGLAQGYAWLVAAVGRVVNHALDYPYELPRESFLLIGAQAFALEVRSGDPVHNAAVVTDGGRFDIDDFCATLGDAFDTSLLGREPVLAYGSNGSPATLVRKLGAAGTVVPVLRGVLEGFDIVFSSHFGPSGAIPAALQADQQSAAEVFIAFLTPAQAEVMHATEPNYHFAQLWGLSFAFENGATLDRLFSYVTRHGILSLEQQEYAVADVRARNRTMPAKTEEQILELVRSTYWADEDFETFVYRNATEPETAKYRTDVLKKTAAAFNWKRWKPVPV